MKVTKYDPKIKGDDDYTWAEPYVGATVSLSYAKKYALFTRCDYGGFGIGSAPEHVYNLTFGASYRATKRISIDAGYKIYDIDYKRGSGDDRFIYDIRQEGIFAGFTFYF